MYMAQDSEKTPEDIVTQKDSSSAGRALESALEGLPQFAVIVDPDGGVTFANPAAGKLFGAGDVVGKKMTQVLAPRAAGRRSIRSRSALTSGTHWQGEIRVILNGGSQALLDLVALRVDTETEGLYDLYLGRDITLRRSLERTNCQMEKVSTRGEMAGEISHELNNYLSILMGNLELMGMALDKGKIDAVAPRLKNMKDGLARIAKFVEGLMSLCRPETRLEAFHIHRLLEEEIFFLKREPRYDGVEFVCRWEDTLPAMEADRSRLRQSLVNILANAADAVANNAPGQRRITIAIAHAPDDGLLRLSIWDNGPGMSEEDYARAFRQFFTTKGPGHGFGLLAVKGGIKSQGGKVSSLPRPRGRRLLFG